MENVLTAIIVIFLLLFGALRLSDRAISSQETLSETWHEQQEGYIEAANTRFSPVESHVAPNSVTVILHNDGSTRLMDFERWDLIATYYDTSGTYRVEYLPFSELAAPSTWRVAGIYLDAATGRSEVFDRGIWNPGEDLMIEVRQSASIGIGEPFQAVLASSYGVAAGITASHDAPPELASNETLTITPGANALIHTALLEVSDADTLTGSLIYTITGTPADGLLIPSRAFSQAQINAGLVSYNHTGTGPGSDTFSFTVSDGETVIGPYTFTITIGE